MFAAALKGRLVGSYALRVCVSGQASSSAILQLSRAYTSSSEREWSHPWLRIFAVGSIFGSCSALVGSSLCEDEGKVSSVQEKKVHMVCPG